ncbi:MAG: hypothetical protein JST11_15930 [Acidobacteria bacterium]|nr:hypothetical protein [Acidobacteriota bacterium]
MNSPLILELLGLRYKLLWAKTRSRNGRIALFLTGYLLLLLLFVLMAFGGFGAAIAAVRAGKSLAIAQAVLTSLFIQAVISTNILGFGMNNLFNETELRRYPLSAADRALARHITSLLDPFWFLFLLLELGFALGLYGLGAAGFWNSTLAVLLMFLVNYLCARVVAAYIDRLMKRKGGPAILLSLVMLLSILPGALAPLFEKNKALGARVVEHLGFLPSFAAADAMLGGFGAASRGFLLLVFWTAAFALLLIRVEKRPPERRAAAATRLTWESPFDRAGAFFGPALGPFVAHWLCFYARNPRTRTLMLLSLPLTAFLTYSTGHTLGADGLFVAALGTASLATFFGTARIAVNQFGYSGGGFRRYLLLPGDPAGALRAGSYASLIMGAAAIPVLLVAWIALVPPFDPRRIVMLLASALTGLFLFNAAGVWVTLLNPRKGNYDSNFGNDLSLGGNVVVIGSVLCAMLLPRLLHHFAPAAVSPQSWWMLLPLPALAAALYRVSLTAAGPVFTARRERLLALVEGRD